MNTVIIKRLRLFGALISVALLSGCGWINEGISDCPAQLRVKFVYDYNMKFADAFNAEVKSVNLWVFDSQSGAPVWSGQAAGQALTDKSYEMIVPVDPGKYDFVAWCGLQDNAGFDLATYTPSSRKDLEVTLKTVQKGQLNVSDSELGGLYHGTINAFNYKINYNAADIQTVTMSLTKDTNAIRVLLQNMSGEEMKASDFTVNITDANSHLAWNNAVLAGPTVTYEPWITSYGAVENQPEQSKAISTVATLLNELSMSRLIAGQECWLTVTRNTDNTQIIRIPLIEYLLLIKGHYGDMTDQEYLDREDDYNLMFLLDENGSWYVAGGIYINSWAVVPPQESPL